jgi:hypothetical protein
MMTEAEVLVAPHEALFRAVDTYDQEKINQILTQVGVNVQDAAGFTVMTRIFIKGSGTIEARIDKARNLHDCSSATIEDMVHGLAAVGEVELAYQWRKDYNVAPIHLARGLAYRGDNKELACYFIKYGRVGEDETQEEKIARVEAAGIFAYALLAAAALHGGKKGLADALIKKMLSINVKQEIQDAGQRVAEHQISALYTKSLWIIGEALGVVGNPGDIKAFIEFIFDCKGILSQFQRYIKQRDVLVHLQTGLAKGGHISLNLKNISPERVSLTDQEIFYCQFRGVIQAGNEATIEAIIGTAQGEGASLTSTQDALSFHFWQCLENGYEGRANQVDDPSKIAIKFRETPASILKGHTLSMASLKKVALSARWAYSTIPKWTYHTLTNPIIGPLDYYISDCSVCNDRNKKLIVSHYNFYCDDRLPRLAPLHTPYGALHFLCFVPEASREEVCTHVFAPILGKAEAKEYLAKANKISKIRNDHQLGFTKALIYGDSCDDILQAQLSCCCLNNDNYPFSRLPPEIKFKIFSFFFMEFKAYKKLCIPYSLYQKVIQEADSAIYTTAMVEEMKSKLESHKSSAESSTTRLSGVDTATESSSPHLSIRNR